MRFCSTRKKGQGSDRDFYRLYFAKEDLNEVSVQWYWDGADRINIDQIIKENFQKYIDIVAETINANE